MIVLTVVIGNFVKGFFFLLHGFGRVQSKTVAKSPKIIQKAFFILNVFKLPHLPFKTLIEFHRAIKYLETWFSGENCKFWNLGTISMAQPLSRIPMPLLPFVLVLFFSIGQINLGIAQNARWTWGQPQSIIQNKKCQLLAFHEPHLLGCTFRYQINGNYRSYWIFNERLNAKSISPPHSKLQIGS